MADEFTAKFKVDISDLKKNISEANKQIKLANATFKAETAGMGQWSKDADGLSKKLEQLKSVLSNQKTVLSSYQQQLEKQQAAYEENGKRAEQLKTKLQELTSQGIKKTDDEYKKYQASLKSVLKEQENNAKACDDLKIEILEQQAAVNKTESDIKYYTSSLEKLEEEQRAAAEAANKQKTAYESLEDTIEEQQAKLDALKSEYANVVVEQGKNSDSAKKLASQIDNLSGELQDNKTKLNDADKAADELDHSLDDASKSAKDAEGGFTVLKGALANLVTQGINLAINGLKNLATSTYEAWQSYDDGADTIIAATGAVGESADGLIEVYKNLAKSVKGNFSDIGTAVGEVNTRFGLTGQQLEDVTAKFIKFADINGLDVKTSIDNVQAAMAAFGLGAENAGDMLDVLNKAGQDTGVSVDQLAASMVANAPALQEMGYNASDAAFFLANLNKNGVDASSVMSGMKKALANAAAEGKPMSAAMSEIEQSIKNANSSTEAITIATELFGAKAGPAIATAVRDGKLSFEEFGTSLTDFQGNIETTYDSMQDGPDKVAVAMQNLRVTAAETFDEFLQKHSPQIEAAISGFTNKVIPALSNALGKALDAISWVIEHAETLATVIEVVGAAVSAFLVVMNWGSIMTAAANMLGKVKTAMLAVNAAIAANPVGLLAAAIAALIVVGVKLIKHLQDEEKAIKSTQKAQEDLTAAKKAAEDAENSYVNAVDRATNAQKALEEAEKASGLSGAELYKQVQAGTLDYANMTDQQKEVYKAYLENDAAQKAVKESTEALTEAKKAETIASFENDLALAKESGSYDDFKKSVIDAYEKGTLSAEEARDLIGAAMSEMSRGAQKTFMQDIPGDIRTGLDPKQYETTGQKMSKWFGGAWTGIKNIFKEAPSWFGEKFGGAWTKIKEKFSGWGQYWGGLWDQVKEKFSSLGTKIGDAISGAVKAGINKVIGLIESRINSAIRLINGAINIINAIPGVEISKIKEVSFPRLAQGGVLKRGQVGLLEGSGAEAVVPLDRNKAWIKAVANDMLNELQGKMGGVASNNSNVSKSNVNNFTQIINAPKQPSRIELYRQTRNLLAYANATGSV